MSLLSAVVAAAAPIFFVVAKTSDLSTLLPIDTEKRGRNVSVRTMYAGGISANHTRQQYAGTNDIVGGGSNK